MIPSLDNLLKKANDLKSSFFQPFTELYIGGGQDCPTVTRDTMFWLLKNIDLKFLTFNGTKIEDVFPAEINLFADKYFVNLAKLSFIQIDFEKTLELTNVPSLESLVLDYCANLSDDPLPLVFPDNLLVQDVCIL